MEEVKQISTNENIVELIELLKKNQMEREALNVMDLLSYIDVLQDKVEMMNNQLDEMRNEVKTVRDIQESTIEAKINKAEDQLIDDINRLSSYMIEQTHLRVDGLKKKLQATKSYIANKAKEIVTDFKQTGKKALLNVSELLRVRHVLSGMKNSVEIGILETNDIISRIDTLGKDMRESKHAIKEARGERRNAIRSFLGKEAMEVDASEKYRKFSKTELAKKPWHWQSGIYESIKLFLESSIDSLNNLEMAVRETMAQNPDYEVDERIFSGYSKALVPVVAEQKHQYGADDFEDYIKTEGSKKPVVDISTPKPPKR